MEGHNDICERRESSSNSKSSKRVKYSRPNVKQIQELEVAFEQNSYPDDKARLELATKLSIDPIQVKYWFQNRRTQVKSQLNRHESRTLKQENEKLRREHIVMKEAMRNPICNRCNNQAIITDNINVDEHQTKTENDRLKDEVKRIRVKAENLLGPLEPTEGSMTFMMKNSRLRLVSRSNDFGGKTVVNVSSPKRIDSGNGQSNTLPVISSWPTIILTDEDAIYDKSILMNFSLAAMNELLKLNEISEPLWVSSSYGGGETLNIEEYARLPVPFICMKSRHFKTEATRASGIVTNNSLTLVETLMDKSRWTEMFPCIIGKTSTFDVISTSVDGSKSGTLLLIKTELKIISDRVPVREMTFLRLFHQHAKDIWVVVDVSVDTVKQGSQQYEIGNCRRFPSGCVVQDMLNGYSKVTWIEHIEYNENLVHYLYRPLIRAGLGFGAQRWIATLQRQSEFLGVMMSYIDPTVCLNGEKSIGMLAQSMTRNFCEGVCQTTHNWETIHLANVEDAKLMKRKNIGQSSGIVLSATKTIWLPVKQQCLFEFLMNEKTRSQWDVLSNSSPMQLMVHISKGQFFDSNISLYRVNGDYNSTEQNDMMILQDTYTDATGSLFVYATIDSIAMNVAKKTEDPSGVALFPYGIAIVPDCFQDHSTVNNYNGTFEKNDNGFCSGSVVTIGFQTLVKGFPATKYVIESAEKANEIISRITNGIKTALKCN